jgi:Peptidase family S41.
MNLAREILFNCTTLFHTNNYKVVVIENRNGGGYGAISIALAQILQVKITTRAYLAYNPLEIFRGDFEYYPENFINVDTCRPYPSFDDFLNGTVDEYQVGNETIYHKKSKIIDIIDLDIRKYLEESRLMLNQTGNLKKPTDIIVFTDSFSYSATCIFIKALQDEGGAIIVGYNGNPKIRK